MKPHTPCHPIPSATACRSRSTTALCTDVSRGTPHKVTHAKHNPVSRWQQGNTTRNHTLPGNILCHRTCEKTVAAATKVACRQQLARHVIQQGLEARLHAAAGHKCEQQQLACLHLTTTSQNKGFPVSRKRGVATTQPPSCPNHSNRHTQLDSKILQPGLGIINTLHVSQPE